LRTTLYGNEFITPGSSHKTGSIYQHLKAHEVFCRTNVRMSGLIQISLWYMSNLLLIIQESLFCR